MSSMYKYLQSYEIKEIIEYCQNRSQNIIKVEIENKPKNELNYFRGKYKGYLYCIKLLKWMLNSKKSYRRYELYNMIKEQKRRVSYSGVVKQGMGGGVIDSFYDILNYISIYTTNQNSDI